MNEKDQVARASKDLMTSIDSLDEKSGLGLSLMIANYAHEYGHKIALDTIGIDGDIGANPFKGHIDFFVLPEQEADLPRNFGAGLEIDQLIAWHGMGNILKGEATLSDYTMIFRNHGFLSYHYDRGGDGKKFKRSVGDEKEFRLSLLSQFLNYSVFLDSPVYFGNRTHLTQFGVDNYYDVYLGDFAASLRDGDGFELSYRYEFLKASFSVHKESRDFSLTFQEKFGDFEAYLNVGHKNTGIFIGRPEKGGLYYSASLSVQF